MKLSVKSYWSPTPKKIRKFADALLAGAMTISSFAMINNHSTLAFSVMIVAGISKFASNFFTEDISEEEKKN